MGKGSDVAREAADMVLLDDFSAIVVALKYGRYESLVPHSIKDWSALFCTRHSSLYERADFQIGRLVHDNLKKTILYLLPAGR